MNEHTIFLAALDITDPAERDAYLTAATGGDAALRQQVERLLAAHLRSGEFLDVPVLRQMVDGSGPDPAFPSKPAEIDLSFLQPSTRPGSLGRLAHYEIEEVIGSGGCGIVLKAFDERLARIVAIKVMAPELAATSPARKRFLREARAAAAIRHENVISIHAVDDLPIPFLVMEHIAGQTLQEKLDETGPLDVREVLQIGQQIASGLAAAHALGLVHRDIKPANVLLERGASRIKITDFGLARSADDASVTQSGVIAGTPLYMSPEQAQGAAIDHRSDLFSLGSVLYVMTSGRPPFRAATTLAVLQRVAEDQPRPIQEIIPETPAWLVGIIARLHAKQPADRYASAQEVADVLARCLAELQQKGRVEFPDGAPAPAPASHATRPAPPPTEFVELPAARNESKAAPALRPARPAPRWLTAAAAIAILLLLGLGLSEAGGVTDLGSTIVRLFSPEGTLVVEVDDPGVSVTIDGEEMVITGAGAKEIRLKPGQYKVLASKDGQVVSQELVTVTRNGRQVVRVSREMEPVVAIGERPASEVAADPDRRAAEWLLSVGSRFSINHEKHPPKELPKTPFRLTDVNLAANPKVTDEALACFQGCRHLTMLNLGENRQVTSNGLAHFKDCQSLEKFIGNRTAIDDEGLKVFAGCKNLTDLSLNETNVTDAWVEHFADLRSLRNFRAEGTTIADQTLALLGKNEQIEYLGLSQTGVTDAGLEQLAKLRTLVELSLGGTQVTDAGLAHVRENKQLTRLVLYSTVVTDQGLTHFLDCKDLVFIQVTYTKVSPEMVQKLARAFPKAYIEHPQGRIEPNRLTNSLGMQFALVPKGKAWLGGGGGHAGDKEVEFKDDFYMGVFEVTREEWETVMGIQFFKSAPQINQHDPVERVSWDACQRFVTLLNAQTRETGWLYRLPTEQEWEYACRGGPMTDKLDGAFDFYFDKPVNTLAPVMANFSHGEASRKRVCNVGTYQPNRLGLYDMHGNVMEWCQDEAPPDPKDPQAAPRRVLRGGSWFSPAQNCRAAAFTSAPLDPVWKEHIGLRLARVRVGTGGAADPDRRAAEYVLSIGGTVRVDGMWGTIEGSAGLPQADFKLTSVGLSQNTLVTDEELACFAGCKHLQQLNLGHTAVGDAGLAHFKGCAGLTDLGLGRTRVTDAGLAHFNGFTELTSLVLYHTDIGDAGLANFQGCIGLVTVDLRFTRVTDAGLTPFAACKSLTALDLSGLKVTDAGLAHFKNCRLLRTLGLSDTQVTDEGLIHLEGLPELRLVHLRQTQVTPTGVEKLAAALPKCKIEWEASAPPPSAALEALRREQIPPEALAFAGGGDPAKAPASLVAVLGEPEHIHTAGISSIALSPDGRWVATAAGGDNSILLREAATGNVRRVLRGHTWSVRFVAFLPDSTTLVSGSADETVKVWSTESEDEPATLPLGVKAELIAVSPDGRFLAAGSRGEVRLWAWGAWNNPTVLPGVEGGKPAALAFSADGETLACGWRVEKSASPITLFRTADGTLERKLEGHPGNLGSVAFSTDGKFLASAQGGKTRLWDLATSQVARELDEALRVCFSPDSQRLVLGGRGGFLVCDTNSGKEIEAARKRVSWGGIGALAFSHDGKTLAVADSSAPARLYDTSTWKPQAALSEPGHGCPVDALAVSPDGRRVLTRGRDHMLRRWLIDGPNEHPIVHEYEKVDRLLAYSPDGTTFVTAESPPLTVWDAATIQPLATIPVSLYSLAYSPDGQLIAGNGIGDDMVYLCDVRSGQVVHRFPSIKEQAFGVAFRSDGSLLATAGNKGRVAVWNVATGAEVAAWTTTPMKSIAFHPDGSLATGHHDGTIAFWDAATWQRQQTFHAHSGAVHRLRFTHGGQTLVSSGVDGVIQVRSPEHERARAVIPIGFVGIPVDFDLDASGQFLFASGPTPVIYVHRLPVEKIWTDADAEDDQICRQLLP